MRHILFVHRFALRIRIPSHAWLFVPLLFWQGEGPNLPEGPIQGADIVSAWLLRFLFAVLGILVGWYAFHASRKSLPQILKDFIDGKNTQENLKFFGRFALAILLMVAAVRLPPVIFGEAASVDAALKGGLGFIKGFWSGFGD